VVRTFKPEQLIEIDWLDAFSNSGWQSEEEARKRPFDVACRTIGYFLQQDKDFIWVSHSIGWSKGAKRDVMLIPIGCIQKIRPIQVKR
jgi:hypothetical protein